MDLWLFLSLLACSLDALVGFISSKISNNPVNQVFFLGVVFFNFVKESNLEPLLLKAW